MTTEQDTANSQAGEVRSSDQLGASLFTAEMFKAAIMTGEQEGRAYRGYCPKCGDHKLRLVSSGADVVFKLCSACGTMVALGA